MSSLLSRNHFKHNCRIAIKNIQYYLINSDMGRRVEEIFLEGKAVSIDDQLQIFILRDFQKLNPL